MEKEFNITGQCFPREHYMADVSAKLARTLALVERGQYFIISRPRQYGKTTMLYNLADVLRKTGEYIVLNTSFERIGDSVFESETTFVQTFFELLARYARVDAPALSDWCKAEAKSLQNFDDLADKIGEFVYQTDKKIVLLIDEVDQSSNNQLFIKFLAVLRNQYLERGIYKTFHSVVLAGLHDVKSLKLKIRPDSEQKYNSPWNIAADYDVDMNLQVHEIIPMLHEYAADRGVTMDVPRIAELLFYYTSGYPFLVSKLCKMLDESVLPLKTERTWTVEDLETTVKKLITQNNVNFDSTVKHLENDESLYRLVYRVAIDGENLNFNGNEPTMNLGVLYGIFADRNGLKIHNRIYNEVIVNYMTAKTEVNQMTYRAEYGQSYKNDDGSLNMRAVMLGFQIFMRKEYSKKDRDFLERNGRLVFLAFIKPIINGAGHDFKETQISEEKRLDVVITHLNEKYVAELKLWRGEKAHERGLIQLADYLTTQHLDEGYLLIFDHSEVKHWQSEDREVQGKKIFAVWV